MFLKLKTFEGSTIINADRITGIRPEGSGSVIYLGVEDFVRVEDTLDQLAVMLGIQDDE